MRHWPGLFLYLLFMAQAALAQQGTAWRYDGPFGPQSWAEISSSYSACAKGHQQSPINLGATIGTYIIPIELNWAKTDWEIEHIGPTVVLRSSTGGSAIIDDEEFRLVQINIRSPSEHTIQGVRYPMELQFMHLGPDNQIAGISQMFIGDGQNSDMDRLIAHIPGKPGEANVLSDMDLQALLADIGDIYRYRGSLTAPPCQENVQWTVLDDPRQVSNAALMAFRSVFKTAARPLQPLNRRYILRD